MPYSLIWLPQVLKAAGLKVAEVEGWQNRGNGNVSQIRGVICHHTVGAKTGNMPSLYSLIHGRPDLTGPLCQLGLGRDGTYYVIAAGRANHAGKGIWQGISTGNSSFIGIEGENHGGVDDKWPDVQMDAYERGVAAILKKIGRGAEFCAAHREYALPVGRKPDPRFDMDDFRARVAALIDGTAPPAPLIPAVEPAIDGGSGRPTLRRGDEGQLVKLIQKKVKVNPTGNFGPVTEAAVRKMQQANGLVPDGIVGPKTWQVLDSIVV